MTISNQSIEVEISGGIGNQLFQFAAALALAQHLHAEVILDVSWYERELQSVDKLVLIIFRRVDRSHNAD